MRTLKFILIVCIVAVAYFNTLRLVSYIETLLQTNTSHHLHNNILRIIEKIEYKDISFKFHAPNAEKVYLAGTFNNWADNKDGKVINDSYLMKKLNNGYWERTEKLQNDWTYKYKFVVDGNTWFPDPHGVPSNDYFQNSMIFIR